MKFFDDDMEELFNKAGRQYPLKTEPKNWEAVRGALLQEQGVTGATQKNGRWRRLLPLLLLLLIPAVYVFIDKRNINEDYVDNKSVTTASDKVISEINTSDKTQESVKPGKPAVIKNRTESISKVSSREVNQPSYVPPLKQTLKNAKKPGEESLNGWNNIPSLNNGPAGMKEPSELILLSTPVRSLDQANGSESVPNSVKKENNKIKRNGIYYGLMGGGDLSTIKGQEIKGVGYSTGIIVGYTLDNRWQLEGGVLWSRKKYYTDGKYFSKEGAQIPSNIKIHWLDGGCKMIEFPLVVRYNLSERKNTFFASAGLTSYMMRKEDYKYSAQAGAGGDNYEGYRSYQRSGDHLFANLQLSAGYKLNLSSKFNISIEPYLKTPLKKIGVGKLPITSTGLNFAISRDLR